MAAMSALECCGVEVEGIRVRDETRVPETLRGVEQAELGTGVRALAPGDEPCVFAPGGQVHEICELCHLSPVTDGPVHLDGFDPVLFLEQQQGLSYTLIDRVADRVLDVRLCKARDEVVGRPGRVGPHENVMSDETRLVTGLVAYLVLRREGTDRLVQQLEMIIGVVRAGVARTEYQRERLSGRVAPGAEGMEAIAVLVLCTWQIRSGELREPVIGSGRWWWWRLRRRVWWGRQSGGRWAWRGPEDGCERLSGRVTPGSDRMKAIPVLVLCTWQIRSGDFREPVIGS